MPHTYANVANAMAPKFSPDEEQDIKDGRILRVFLKIVRKGVKGDVKAFLSSHIRTDKERERNPDTNKCLSKPLLDALDEGDIIEIWKLIVEMEEKQEHETIGTLSAKFKDIVEEENVKDNGFSFECLRLKSLCISIKGSIMACGEKLITEEKKENLKDNYEQTWIKILSNPLYIGLEWLWRNKPHSPSNIRKESKEVKSTDVVPHQETDDTPLVPVPSGNHSTNNGDENKNRTEEDDKKRRKFEGVVEAALFDARLLVKRSFYKHDLNRDEYLKCATECEIFAADVVDQADRFKELVRIMDFEGKGALLKETSKEFIHSLSLLKIATDKKQKKFVTSPKCQFILDEVIYRDCPEWQDKGILKKTLLFCLQLIFVIITSIGYIFILLCPKCTTCVENPRLWKFKKQFEHPYSKFINHVMSYVAFLCLIYASSFEYEIRAGWGALTWIDYAVISYVIGLLLQEVVECCNQGWSIYFSKWWNVVDTLIVFLFLLSYTVWLGAWGCNKEWNPGKNAFTVADAIYSSASVLAFFHLAHFFQVSSVLGPLQLSLYRMLRDVLKFLLIFLVLYVAFSTGMAKIYSYYVASEMELSKRDNRTSYHQLSHPFALHVNTFIGLFWFLFGGGGEEKSISVRDQEFLLVTEFGRIFMGAYVICTGMVALNMLVAMMNDSFRRIMENAQEEWKFSRTEMWLEWIDKSNTVPVPFNILYVVLLCCKRALSIVLIKSDVNQDKPCCCCCMRKCCCRESCCKNLPPSTTEERIVVMKNLVVDYLEGRYSDKWTDTWQNVVDG